MATGNVSGLDQWVRNLHQIERHMQVNAGEAVDAAMDEHVNVSNPLTPVRTGYLRSNNQKRWIEHGPYKYVGEYFNNTPYGPFVAFGTYKMRARDFVTPGYYSGRKVLLERAGKVL